MKKSFIFSIVLAIVITLFSLYNVFATDGNMSTDNMSNVGEGVKNVVSDAKNTVEGGVLKVENGVSDAARTTGNAISNVTSGIGTTNNNSNNAITNNNTTVGSNYTTARTSTTSEATFAGMTATAWTWLIVAVFGILIIATVWFYAKQHTTTKDTDE